MPDWLSAHPPFLVNTIGHAVAMVVFGVLLWFLWLNYRRDDGPGRALPLWAAGMAVAWNAGALAELGAGATPGPALRWMAALGFAALSLLPALLLHIWVGPKRRWVVACGYALGAAAVALHLGDLATGNRGFHTAGLWVVTIGFAALTLTVLGLELGQGAVAPWRRLAAGMALLLLVVSYVHFGETGAGLPWFEELVLHHAGLPLALFLLLQDVRFLLLDAFARVTLAAGLGGVAVAGSLLAWQRLPPAAVRQPFVAGLLLVAGGMTLALFVWWHGRLQRWVTRVLFLRTPVEGALHQLQDLRRVVGTDADYLRCAVEVVARFVRATRFALAPVAAAAGPALIIDNHQGHPGWARAAVPLRFSRGDGRTLLLGRREGGRRYLDEELRLLGRLAAAITEHVEQLRAAEMDRLVAEAELQALQAQIHPHFLFNALNALYGTIDRGNTEARLMVLRLAEMFRQLLRTERTLVTLEEELRIVAAYLEIERLRLGPKLRSDWTVADGALAVQVPPLAVQTLVENAVRHGVAAHAGPGFVGLRITSGEDAVHIEVSNSGEYRPGQGRDGGLGLSNLRRRLGLCFGEAAQFQLRAADGVTRASFRVPLAAARAAALRASA